MELLRTLQERLDLVLEIVAGVGYKICQVGGCNVAPPGEGCGVGH